MEENDWSILNNKMNHTTNNFLFAVLTIATIAIALISMPLLLITNVYAKQSGLTKVSDSDLLDNFTIWGCMMELNSTIYNCPEGADMSNAASTWVGIIIGALIGLGITWYIYYKQNQTSKKQDEVIEHIKNLEESHDDILNKILNLEEKIDNIIENKVTDTSDRKNSPI